MTLNKQPEDAPEQRFSKRQLLAAKRFRDRRDLLSAVLTGAPDSAEFTVKETEARMRAYQKGTVK